MGARRRYHQTQLRIAWRLPTYAVKDWAAWITLPSAPATIASTMIRRSRSRPVTTPTRDDGDESIVRTARRTAAPGIAGAASGVPPPPTVWLASVGSADGSGGNTTTRAQGSTNSCTTRYAPSRVAPRSPSRRGSPFGSVEGGD